MTVEREERSSNDSGTVAWVAHIYCGTEVTTRGNRFTYSGNAGNDKYNKFYPKREERRSRIHIEIMIGEAQERAGVYNDKWAHIGMRVVSIRNVSLIHQRPFERKAVCWWTFRSAWVEVLVCVQVPVFSNRGRLRHVAG